MPESDHSVGPHCCGGATLPSLNVPTWQKILWSCQDVRNYQYMWHFGPSGASFGDAVHGMSGDGGEYGLANFATARCLAEPSGPWRSRYRSPTGQAVNG